MVVLGLGSNIIHESGDRPHFIRQAIRLLKFSSDINLVSISPIYESDALLPEGAPKNWDLPYLNLCVLCHTTLTPLDLLRTVKKIEDQLGRKDRGKWAPREIDIDILCMDHMTFENSELKIPHPSLLIRPFAMIPLADLVPHWKWPLSGPNQGITAKNYISQWKSEQIPFQTHRSTLFLTELVGILNITPNSFSDGGLFQTPPVALKQAQNLLKGGARILDIGAESTRPGGAPISAQEEWNRLEPVLSGLKSIDVPPHILSVDTRNFEVAKRAIGSGAKWINDVTGFESQEMQKVVVNHDVELVFMHSLSVPVDQKSYLPKNQDPISLILKWGENRIQELIRAGIQRERLIFDPGIGFGKTQQQNWDILKGIHRFQELGVRILVGHSRKSFLNSITSVPFSERDIETLAITLDQAKKGIDYLRVHDTFINTRCLKSWTQLDGIIQCQN